MESVFINDNLVVTVLRIGDNVSRTPTGQPFDVPGKPLSGKLRRL